MYCIHCGAEGAMAFCAVCGQRQGPEVHDARESASEEAIVEAAVPWTDSIRYDTVVGHRDARERIAATSRGAGHAITGNDLMAVFDAVSPIGFSVGSFTKAILPIYDKLGIRTGRQAEAVFDAPPGRVLLASLCALAAKSLVIAEVQQDTDKCSLTAEIPLGLITNRGKLHVLLQTSDRCVKVALATTIVGQWYDWGKSARLIDEMFAFIQADLTGQRSGQQPNARGAA